MVTVVPLFTPSLGIERLRFLLRLAAD
jgi:hypothetical protein